VNFPQLSDEQWEKLPDDGVLKVASVKFKPGTTELTTEGEQVLAEYADLIINHYQNSRFEIQGHTAPGDEEANRVLSQERADAIVRRLVDGHGVNPNRLRAVGLGSTKPFPQGTDESNRAYTARLSRVQFHLKKGNSL
jgi:outer membrane protein OmpA-like peptidoglycan-associated protein